ncbi:MAG: hypothetical protein H0X64_06795 [Gemmatimonadaceae bacterium]|nr:hypothetical protein [Gemmatimonadaceae bacterium]
MNRLRVTVLATAMVAVAGLAVAQQGAESADAGLAAAGERQDSAAIILREVFEYQAAGRRDPFAPLLNTAELRPTIQELRLTGVLVHPTRPIAVMRDGDGTQYRVTTGMSVGRMRVVQIKPRTVVFQYQEYGYDRRDSLVLGDTAQVRP